MKKKRFLWLIIPGVIIAGAVGALFYFRAHPVQTQASTVDLTKFTTTKVVQGTVSTGVSATGTVRTNQSGTVTWGISGKVSQVLVAKGDTVKSGQILAQIDASSSTDLITAQANLTSAEQNLADLQDVSVSQANAKIALINAQSAVDTAQTTLDNLKAIPTQAQINSAYATYLSDQQSTAKFQTIFDQWASYPVDNVNRAEALRDLENAQQTEASALQYYNYLKNFTPDSASVTQAEANLALAQAQLVVAQADYDAVKNGPDQAKIAAAQANIDQIKATIDKQFVRAPFDGTITAVSVNVGDTVNNGATAFTISDMSTMYIDLQVSEVDINSIKDGQLVQLTYDAIANKTYTGKVTDIGMIGTVSNGVANFTVTAQLTDADSSVHPGMTATATIVTQEAANVLLVPNNSVVTAGTNKVVYVIANSQLTIVPVTVGLVSDSKTEVTSTKLAVGDTVVTNPSVMTASSTSSSSASIFSSLFRALGVTTTGSVTGGGPGGNFSGGTPPDFGGSAPSGNPPSGNPPSGSSSGTGG